MSAYGGPVVFRGDGEPTPPSDMIRRLTEIDAREPIAPDNYTLGGTVERLECALAEELGKEAAIFMATGTLANLLALRRHCQGRGSRVLLQEQSHVYNDTGDGATQLAGLTLIPLGRGCPAFTTAELADAIAGSEAGRVATPVGCVSVESPVRRQHGRVVAYTEMRAITALCRERGIPTHLDGARLYMMAAATGVSVRQYCAEFDSVYVSLWKYLGAPFGAVLAGTHDLVDGLYHERRMFGGGLPSSALAAALVLDRLPGFAGRFAQALDKAKALFDLLHSRLGLRVRSFHDGSNIFELDLPGQVDAERFVAKLAAAGVVVPASADRMVTLTVNTTVLRHDNESLVAAFAAAL